MRHLETRSISLVAIFSALYYVMSYLPGIPAIGVPGVKIQLEACMASVFGLILGPYLGALASFMGVFVSWALPPGSMSPSGLVFLPSPVINAFLVGLIHGKKWKSAFAILAVLVAAFWFLPPAQPTEQYFLIGVAAMWDKILALLLIVPTTILMERTLKISRVAERTLGRAEKLTIPFVLSLLASGFVLMNGWMIAVNGDILKFQFGDYKISFGVKELVRPIAPYGYLWLLIGVAILATAMLLYTNPRRNLLWGSLIFLFSCFSAVIGGGFIVGLILGVLASFLASIRKNLPIPKMTNVEMLLYFLLAFVGNEADNAWGNDVFALPIVYDGIFQMPIEAVRVAFLVSPYAYFIVRLIQAVIASLIAVPLIRNIKASGLGVFRSTAD